MISKLTDIRKKADIGEYCVIEDYVVIGDNAVIGNHVVIHSGTVIGNDVVIGDFACIGKMTSRARKAKKGEELPPPCFIGNGAEIGTSAVIYRGVTIPDGKRVDDLTVVRADAP